MKWQRSHSTTTFLGNGHILLRINGNFGIFLIPIAVTCDEDFVKSVDRIAKYSCTCDDDTISIPHFWKQISWVSIY